MDITIILTNYFCGEYIRNLHDTLSEFREYNWVIACNQGDGSIKSFFSESDNVKLIDGATEENLPKTSKKNPDYYYQKITGSHFHGHGLDLALNEVSTNKLLVIDADSVLVRNPEEIFSYMEDTNIAFYGPPYWASKKKLIKNVPVATCLFIDLGIVDKKEISFYPNELPNIIHDGKYHVDTGYRIYRYLYQKYKYGCCEFLQNPVQEFPELIKSRGDIYKFKGEVLGLHAHARMGLKLDRVDRLTPKELRRFFKKWRPKY